MKIEQAEFNGRPAFKIATSTTELVAIAEFGPRIAGFGRRAGRNLLYWDSNQTVKRNHWFLRGGHRIWMTRPLADETEETYAPDNEPCEIFTTHDMLRLVAPADPATRIQRSLEIGAESDNVFSIRNIITNTGDMLWSGGIWSITATATAPGISYGIPIGDDSDWDTVTVVIPRKWGGIHTSRADDPQFQFTGNCLLLIPQQREGKRMVQAAPGAIGMTDTNEAITFVKTAPYLSGVQYPLDTNVAVYISGDGQIVEMELMGPQLVLKPGQRMELAEHWSLRPPIDWKHFHRTDF